MNRNGLIILQVVGGLPILAYPFVLLADVMSIAAPGQKGIGTVALVLLSTYPLLWGALYWISWRAMARGAMGLAFGLSSIPVVPLLAAAGLWVYGWVGFLNGLQGPITDAQHKIEPKSPLLWAVWSVGGENRFPPGPSLPAERAVRAIEANPTLVNVSVPPYGSPLKVAVEDLSIDLDGSPITYIPRQYELMNVVRVLVAHGAHFGPGENTNLRNEWLLRRAMWGENEITTESENPLVWRILTRKRDGTTIFSMQPEEKPLVNKPTKLHGTPLYAALLQDAPDAYTEVIKQGGRLSAEEERDPAAAPALEKVLARDFDLRRAYAKAP